MKLDATDRAILRILMEDARTPFSEIARRIDMSSATVHDRVGRMEDAGVIEGYHAHIDPDRLDSEPRRWSAFRSNKDTKKRRCRNYETSKVFKKSI